MKLVALVEGLLIGSLQTHTVTLLLSCFRERLGSSSRKGLCVNTHNKEMEVSLAGVLVLLNLLYYLLLRF